MLRITTSVFVVSVFLAVASGGGASHGKAIIIDHHDTDITALSEAAIQLARDSLHIAYGRSSHGTQIPRGMEGLVGFANNGGLGLLLPAGIFAWTAGGAGGALDFRDQFAPGDAGAYPGWVSDTRDYLAAHPEVNVVMWAWCVNELEWYPTEWVTERYLEPMAQLESDYPDVTFVYMTSPSPYDNRMHKEATMRRNNQHIRDYAMANGKVLYDFWDIEHYDPDGTYFEFTSDACNYYESAPGPLLGNWAIEWQNSHMEGSDWYLTDNEYTHTEHLNINQKAYAAWTLWTEIATQTKWQGDVGDDWFAAANWKNGVPDNLKDAHVGGVATDQYPTISSGAAQARSLFVGNDSGGTLCMGADAQLTVQELTEFHAHGSLDAEPGAVINTGDAVLNTGCTLNLQASHSLPTPGDMTWTLINATGTCTGTFTNAPTPNDHLGCGLFHRSVDHSEPTSVKVHVFQAGPGDFDGDGDVDLDDLSLLDDGWDPTATDKIWTDGDGDRDGDVDLDDLSLLDDHWAPAGYPHVNCGGAAPVPEPSSFILLSMGGVGVLAYAWRKRRRR